MENSDNSRKRNRENFKSIFLQTQLFKIPNAQENLGWGEFLEAFLSLVNVPTATARAEAGRRRAYAASGL